MYACLFKKCSGILCECFASFLLCLNPSLSLVRHICLRPLRKTHAENIVWIFSLTFDYYEHKVIFHQYSIKIPHTTKYYIISTSLHVVVLM